MYVKAMMSFAFVATTTAMAQTPLERGGYLVNTVMTCHNCHTPMGPAGPNFERGLSGGITFDEPPFKVTASNITPDKETGIGAWSEADIKKALLDGVRPNGVPLAPIMPTGFYGILTPADLNAVTAYVKSVKPVANQVPGPVYKMAVQRQIFPGAEKPAADADLKDKVKLGHYLVTIAHCMECHSPRVKGDLDLEAIGKGGQEFKGPWGVSVSRNITSSKAKGIGAWSDAEIKRAITQGVARDGAKLKPPMGYPYYARMTDGDLDAMVAYLRTVPAKE